MRPSFKIFFFLFAAGCFLTLVCCKDPFLREDVDNIKKQEEAQKNENKDENQNYIRQVTNPQAALATPNCIMATPGETVSIPIAKAFAVWEENQKLFGKKFTPKGDLAPVLVWALPNDLVDVEEMEITDYEDINKAAIRLKIKPGASGNALVALTVQGEVRWSWHLWVSDYKPAADIALGALQTGPNQVPGGKVFRYKNYCGDNIFMDRNLGATSGNKADGIKTHGMYYQWGRKDPFPGFGVPNFIPDDLTALFYTPAEYRKNNLAYTIEFPDEIIVGKYDWYSYYPTEHSDDLWGGITGKKTIYDPCPEGWRVALAKPEIKTKEGGRHIPDHHSPFYILEPENEVVSVEAQPNFNSVPPCESPVLGFFPGTGILIRNGSGVGTTRCIDLWTASPSIPLNKDIVGSSILAILGYDATYPLEKPNVASYANRDIGLNLRCIRDLKK